MPCEMDDVNLNLSPSPFRVSPVARGAVVCRFSFVVVCLATKRKILSTHSSTTTCAQQCTPLYIYLFSGYVYRLPVYYRNQRMKIFVYRKTIDWMHYIGRIAMVDAKCKGRWKLAREKVHSSKQTIETKWMRCVPPTEIFSRATGLSFFWGEVTDCVCIVSDDDISVYFDRDYIAVFLSLTHAASIFFAGSVLSYFWVIFDAWCGEPLCILLLPPFAISLLHFIHWRHDYRTCYFSLLLLLLLLNLTTQ